MSDPEVNKVSRRVYQLSGALGCFPSLLFFLLITGGGWNNASTFGLISVVCGGLGVAGLMAAAGIRRSDNKSQNQELDESGD